MALHLLVQCPPWQLQGFHHPLDLTFVLAQGGAQALRLEGFHLFDQRWPAVALLGTGRPQPQGMAFCGIGQLADIAWPIVGQQLRQLCPG
ncbi:hypothetical protein D3C76_1523690 [compost metagenome]